jgi:hypothetical protein
MRESIKNRAAAIRHYLAGQTDLVAGPATMYGYSLTAAQWESLRLLIDTGMGTPADDRRLAELGRVLKTFTKQIGLGDDLTGSRGFLVRDPQRLMYDTWQEAAEAW